MSFKKLSTFFTGLLLGGTGVLLFQYVALDWPILKNKNHISETSGRDKLHRIHGEALRVNTAESLKTMKHMDLGKRLLSQYPSLTWLANGEVAVSREGVASDNVKRYSLRLFKQPYDEFDRTVTSIECLWMVLSGEQKDFEHFTEKQAEAGIAPLSKHSFCQLKEWMNETLLLSGLAEKEFISMVEVGLVISDLGKSPGFRDHAVTVEKAADHDQYLVHLAEALSKQPELITSFQHLNPDAQSLLLRSIKAPHYGHISHLEGGPEIFSPLTGMDKAAFLLSLTLHIFDVAGARGHMEPGTSITYGEQVHTSMQAIRKVGEQMITGDLQPSKGYTEYLNYRAKLLGFDRVDDGKARAMVRIGCMMRLYTPEDGQSLLKAFSAIPEITLTKIITAFDLTQVDSRRVTPTYMPAVLVNLMENRAISDDRDERLYHAVTQGVPFLVNALSLKDRVDAGVPLCFNAIAGKARSAEAEDILRLPLHVDASNGIVTVESTSH